MNLSNSQRNTIESLVKPLIESIVVAFPRNGSSNDARHILWNIFMGGRGVSINAKGFSKIVAELNSDLQNTIIKLMKLYSGMTDIFPDDAPISKPKSGNICAVILRTSLNVLKKTFPSDSSFPEIPEIPSHVQAMERIRALFMQYATLTMSGSIERNLLALEILLEKENLNIPSFMLSSHNIYFTDTGYAPGDFSGLDLSKMQIVRESQYGSGDFKGWHLKNTNFDGTTFKGLCFMGANFEWGSLRGVDFTGNYETVNIVFHNADIAGMYAGADHVPSRKERNYQDISKCEDSLKQFRISNGLMIENKDTSLIHKEEPLDGKGKTFLNQYKKTSIKPNIADSNNTAQLCDSMDKDISDTEMTLSSFGKKLIKRF